MRKMAPSICIFKSYSIYIIKELSVNQLYALQNIDIPKEYSKRQEGKQLINLVVIGHVDAGKSTLMGHLLYLLGQVSVLGCPATSLSGVMSPGMYQTANCSTQSLFAVLFSSQTMP